MRLAHRWLDRNLTRLELAAALTIIILVMGTFMRYLQAVFARAEMSMVDTTIINLNSSLKYHAAMAVMRGDYAQLALMEKMNPVSEVQSLQNGYGNIPASLDLVARTAAYPAFNRPANYLGERVSPALDTLQKGAWYFDPVKTTLNYHVRYSATLFGDNDIDSLLRFKVHIRYTDNNGDGRYNPRIDRFLSISVDKLKAGEG